MELQPTAVSVCLGTVAATVVPTLTTAPPTLARMEAHAL